jgi:hypothetical protein
MVEHHYRIWLLGPRQGRSTRKSLLCELAPAAAVQGPRELHGQQNVDEEAEVSAPNTRAAASIFGSICSMKGIITR